MSVFYGRNDLAIVGRIPYEERLEAIPFPDHEADELFLAVPPHHPLSGAEEVSLQELTDVPLILRERGSGTRHVILQRFEEQGLSPRILLEAGNVDFIKDLIEQGAGVGILGEISVVEEVRRGILKAIPISGRPALRIDVVLPKGGHRSVPVKEFLKAIAVSG